MIPMAHGCDHSCNGQKHHEKELVVFVERRKKNHHTEKKPVLLILPGPAPCAVDASMEIRSCSEDQKHSVNKQRHQKIARLHQVTYVVLKVKRHQGVERGGTESKRVGQLKAPTDPVGREKRQWKGQYIIEIQRCDDVARDRIRDQEQGGVRLEQEI